MEYEALRGAALGCRGGAPSLGAALFLRRGMAAWMRGWAEVKQARGLSACGHAQAGPAEREGPGGEEARPVAVGEELVVVLATMALRAREEG